MEVDTVSQICFNAQNALDNYKRVSPKARYDFLHIIARNLLANQHDIINTAHAETYIQIPDLTAEFNRTIFQIQNYSETLLIHHDSVSENGLSLEYEPIGCVAVFGASNFPLAYSTIGGDVVCALVAGNSVIFKAHEAHKKTSQLVAECIHQAITQTNMPQYVFQHCMDLSHEQAELLVVNPIIKAVGFTGSLAVGRRLFDLCQQRPHPIPFFGELGSINPVFICKDIFEKNYDKIAYDYAQAFTKRGGQLCVNPAVLIIPKSSVMSDFFVLLNKYLETVLPQTMLTPNILEKFKQAYAYRKENYFMITDCSLRNDDTCIPPVLFTVSSDEWLSDDLLWHEVFGMMGIVIDYDTDDDLFKIAESFGGQLTASIHGIQFDKPTMKSLVQILSPKVGRLVFNSFPCRVVVDDNMQHGGVYPASTCSQFTAVGTRAIMRFLRPVCYENKPHFLNDYTHKHNYFIAKTPTEQTQKLVNFIGRKLNDAVFENGVASLGIAWQGHSDLFLNHLLAENIKWECVKIYILHSSNSVITDIQTPAKIMDIQTHTQINDYKYDCFILDKTNADIMDKISAVNTVCLIVSDDKIIDNSVLNKTKLNIFMN